jgi:signal peptidase I
MTSLIYTEAFANEPHAGSRTAIMRHSDLLGAVIDEALATGTMVRFHAEGTSMYPTIRDGEAITIARVAPDDVVRGDLLLCRQGRRVIAHRLVGIATRGAIRIFELRGDAKAACDAPVAADAVVGRIIAVHRNGRSVRLCGRAARLRHEARAVASSFWRSCRRIPCIIASK